MARWRDTRRFGPGPFLLGFERQSWGEGFPFDVPAMATIDRLRLDQPVTLLTGDNGSGKSTVLEAVAQAIGFADQGGELERLGELPAVPRAVLRGALAPVLSGTKPRNGYYLRAESFFNVAAFIDSGAKFAPDLSLYGDVPLHEQSHGESFLALASNRFGADGLYLLDEPEAALSVTGSLALLAVIMRAAESGAQFVIVTHSPILLAAPLARIYELDENGSTPLSTTSWRRFSSPAPSSMRPSDTCGPSAATRTGTTRPLSRRDRQREVAAGVGLEDGLDNVLSEPYGTSGEWCNWRAREALTLQDLVRIQAPQYRGFSRKFLRSPAFSVRGAN